ncbi:DEAD/DEAH box helicase [Candidatus Collierbacteria bacterium]|nr:DEAD/DEAH box helicase [Candidatus Collierbacteria bacterium]
MKITPYHAKYFAYELTKRCSSDSLEKLSSTLSNAQVDLNPHQIEAALFAFKSPLSKGAILADEVGLGKTIEAGLVLSQKWAERKRKILLIVPAALRKQWNTELQEKFFLPSVILETKSFNQCIKEGNLNPFSQEDKITICSYHFARGKASYVKQTKWDLAVIDEAHRLRNVYKPSNKIAREIKNSLSDVLKILLTATPLQNSLLELYGLVSIIDDHVFGDLKSFKADYSHSPREQEVLTDIIEKVVDPKHQLFTDLRNRLKPVCIRTLRRQVLEYIKYTERKPITQDYVPTKQEIELYDGMSEYLQRPTLYALPSSQRQLMTLILRKLLASSSFAIASTLNNLVIKLGLVIDETKKKLETTPAEFDTTDIAQNFEGFEDMSEEWIDDEEGDEDEETSKKAKVYSKDDIPLMEQEKKDLEKFRDLAKAIFTNSKGDALLIALKKGFEMTKELGAKQKAIIFTESTITQRYLSETLLPENGYQDKIVLFNGSNNDPKSKEVYKNWLEKNKDTDKLTGSKTADMRSALIDYFHDEADIMIATEAAAEGVNLQFCSLVINYDLPWNPQRIEQRIGRCHRYGQKHDVVVINFVNRKNAADSRVYDLLDQKFKLFKGVFGASDEVLGNIESGVDFEKRIAAIYQDCRTTEEINTAFDKLQEEMDESIQNNLSDTRQTLLENFDAEVHEKLKLNLRESTMYLDTYNRWLWDTTRFYLGDNAEFSEHEYSFVLKNNPFPNEEIDAGPYKIGKNVEDAHVYRPGHSLAQKIMTDIKSKQSEEAEIVFNYSDNQAIITVLQPYIGKSGVLKISNFTVESFEAEDNIILSAMTESGEVVEPEIIKKIFQLSADSITPLQIPNENKNKLDDLEDKYVKIVSTQIAERNGSFFDHEVDKLDNWAEDVKKGLEIDLRKLDIGIKMSKTNAKKIISLDEKLKAQREIKDWEKKRNEMRKRLFETQDEVELKKEKLLESVEARLAQHSNIEPLFTIRWKIT